MIVLYITLPDVCMIQVLWTYTLTILEKLRQKRKKKEIVNQKKDQDFISMKALSFTLPDVNMIQVPWLYHTSQ